MFLREKLWWGGIGDGERAGVGSLTLPPLAYTHYLIWSTLTDSEPMSPMSVLRLWKGGMSGYGVEATEALALELCR